jgi:hypothetical protein
MNPSSSAPMNKPQSTILNHQSSFPLLSAFCSLLSSLSRSSSFRGTTVKDSPCHPVTKLSDYGSMRFLEHLSRIRSAENSKKVTLIPMLIRQVFSLIPTFPAWFRDCRLSRGVFVFSSFRGTNTPSSNVHGPSSTFHRLIPHATQEHITPSFIVVILPKDWTQGKERSRIERSPNGHDKANIYAGTSGVGPPFGR